MKTEWNQSAAAGLILAMRNISEVLALLADEHNREMDTKELKRCVDCVEMAVANASNTVSYFKFALGVPLEDI